MRQFLQPDDWNSVPVVRPLTMATVDGTRYARSAAVESEIAETTGWSEADVLGKRKSLSNEALVYNVRRFLGSDDAVCGLLLRELGQRTIRIVKGATQGLDRLEKEDIAMQVEMDVLELVIAPQPSRKSEFLEMAFVQAVRCRAMNLSEQMSRTVQGRRGRYKPSPILDLDEQDKKRKRPLEFAPDHRNGPEAALAAFQDEQFRSQAYDVVQAALQGEDNRLLPAFQYYVVERWPLWSADPDLPTIARHFSLSHGQAKYLLERARKIIADVLSAYSAQTKVAAPGVKA